MTAGNEYSGGKISKLDLDLWDDLRAGQKEALQQLFLRYHDDLYRYGQAFCSHKASVKDSIQDLFYELWEKHARLSRVDNVKAYLWISFRRTLIKKLKKLKKSVRLFETEVKHVGVAASTETVMIEKERICINKQLLKKALTTLSEKEREALYLKYYEGMSYREIQMIMDISYQTARNYVYRAIGNLRETIETQLDTKTASVKPEIMLLLLFLL